MNLLLAGAIALALNVCETEAFQHLAHRLACDRNPCVLKASRLKVNDDILPTKNIPVSVKGSITEVLTDETSKSKKATKRSKPAAFEPAHWISAQDQFTVKHHNGQLSLLRLTIRGNPLPLRRHRSNQGVIYNPSAPAQASFRQFVQELVSDHLLHDDDNTPLFGDSPLAMTLVFRLKRPKIHFVASRPGAGRLKDTAPTTAVGKADVDNLAKFVLDSLNGVAYEDDQQIVSLHAIKLLDNQDECLGSTELCIRTVTSHALFAPNAFNLV
jgi:Holliday junction resolvase RusA-like endonuclease